MKKNFTKITALALATAMIATSFVGCGAKEEAAAPAEDATTEEAPAEEATEEEAPAEDVEEVTLRWFNVSPGGKQKDADTVLAAFNEELQNYVPGVTVTMDYTAPSEYQEKFDLAMASGEVIDIAWKGYMMDNAATFASGAFQDLTPFVDEEITAAIPEFLLQGATIQGELMYLPKVEMHHWVEGMYTSVPAYDACFPVEEYQAAMDDYYANAETRCYTDAMYAVLETYMANAEEAGMLGSGFSPYVATNWKGLELIKHTEQFPAVLAVPNTGREWDTTVINLYAQPEVEEWFAKLAEWTEKGWMRNDLLGMENPRVYENTNEDGNLIWYHNYVNPDDVDCTGVFYDVPREGWADNYVVVPFSGSAITNSSNDGIGIPFTSEHPEKAMEVIKLMYTEEGKDIKKLLNFGIEGTHYTQVADGRVEYVEGVGGCAEDNAYGLPVWGLGNCLTAQLLPGQGDNQYTYYGEIIEASLQSPMIGFTFDPSGLDAKLTALKSATSEYVVPFLAGGYTPEKYAEYLAKLEELDINSIIEELQAQVDAFVQ